MKLKRWLVAGLLVMLIGGIIALPAFSARAEGTLPQDTFLTPTPTPVVPSPARVTILNIEVERTTWWLLRWSDNRVSCIIAVEHEGYPTPAEVLYTCGENAYNEYLATAPCDQSVGADSSQCPGIYFHQVSSEHVQKKIKVQLPEAVVWVSLVGCNPQPPKNSCSHLPSLLFTAQEPLPNEAITRLQGRLGKRPFSCTGTRCLVPLAPTGLKGEMVEFWADSSFGDTTQHYTALVRVQPWGNFTAPEGPKNDPKTFYVDVLSSQWRGTRPASCSDVWGAFADVSGPPEWLSTPNQFEDLKSDISYYYLAGMLIQNGVVDAGACPADGLQADMTATQCGLEAALPQVKAWQNRFDTEIMQASKDTGVPAQLMKNIFSRESQLWPGLYNNYAEAGLGQLTENGADTVLLWNESFYNQFCPLVLSQETCNSPFNQLPSEDQAMLRGALVQKVNASCTSCEDGIDLSQANVSVKVFAHSLQANCEQVRQVITNMTEQRPGELSSYEDLWKFTLVNYNAGTGCLANAINATLGNQDPLDWYHLANNLEPGCQGAISYIEDISQVPGAAPTPTPWLGNAPTPTPPITGSNSGDFQDFSGNPDTFE